MCTWSTLKVSSQSSGVISLVIGIQCVNENRVDLHCFLKKVENFEKLYTQCFKMECTASSKWHCPMAIMMSQLSDFIDELIHIIHLETWVENLEDNYIQNYHLGRYTIGFTVGYLVLQRRISRAVKRDFHRYIWWKTIQNEDFKYCYPNSNALV